jgi:16S rRNA (cytidine1402-2'-O)-methyltransferase
MAHMSSGMNGQSFAFNGYLPIDKSDRKKKIKQLERQSRDYNQSQSFIETPYRNVKMVEEIIGTCAPSTLLCIACDITLDSEFIQTKPVKAWKKVKLDHLHKRPCIFIIQG